MQQEESIKTNIFIIGPTRTATTWLYENFKKLSSFSLSDKKELYFFDKNHHLGISWYDKKYKNNRIRIDISPTYFGSLQAIRNIKKYNSSPIVIVILRNQFELILSKYNYCIQNGKFKKSIEDFWKEETNEREEYLYYKYIELWKKTYQ